MVCDQNIKASLFLFRARDEMLREVVINKMEIRIEIQDFTETNEKEFVYKGKSEESRLHQLYNQRPPTRIKVMNEKWMEDRILLEVANLYFSDTLLAEPFWKKNFLNVLFYIVPVMEEKWIA